MQKYLYPAGCSFGKGEPTLSETVCGPVAFIDPNGIQRPRTIFKNPTTLALIGVKPWREERPAPGHRIVEGTTPTDTEINGEIVRTWQTEPIPGYEEEQLMLTQMSVIDAIEASYKERFKALDDALINLLWVGDDNQNSGRLALLAERETLQQEKQNEIFNVFLEA